MLFDPSRIAVLNCLYPFFRYVERFEQVVFVPVRRFLVKIIQLGS